MVNKVAMGQVFLRVLQFPVNITAGIEADRKKDR
jgi:hypothetical protein